MRKLFCQLRAYDLKILLSSVIKIAENILTNDELENFKVAQEKFLSKMRL